MAVKSVKEMSVTPCDICKHSKFEMIDQFSYRTWCSKDAKDGVFESPWGCYKFKRKGEKHRKALD